MKKTISLFLATAMLFIASGVTAPTAIAKSAKSQINSLIESYRSVDGFEVVKVGALGSLAIKALIKSAANSDNDPEVAALLDAISGIKKIAVVDYEDCSLTAKKAINEKLSRICKECELIIEAKDDGDDMRIYGTVSKDGSTMSDFILYSPSECSLICLFGTVKTDSLKLAVEE